VASGSIAFEGVWKKFRRGELHDSLKDLIPSMVRRAFRPAREGELESQEFWALRDVSFEVGPGEALGIIGPNGAGKSTTLKLLTRILKPTLGHCRVQGRAGALIEVAAGFHPDLTGRENVFLQGAILGMRQAEVQKRFDEIVDFAGIEDFIDTPVKRYSSGMNARLGFSIAANLDPEVLIIDEVLSVGDMTFREKCVQRMLQFRRNGVAIVYVSHNLPSVATLCDRALHLNHETRLIGPTADVIESYIASRSPDEATAGGAEIVAVVLTDPDGTRVQQISPGDRLVLHVDYALPPSAEDLAFAMNMVRSGDSLLVHHAIYSMAALGLASPVASGGAVPAGDGRVRVHVEFHMRANVVSGQYHFGCAIIDDRTEHRLHHMHHAASVTVREDRPRLGVADLYVRPRARLGRMGDRPDPGAAVENR